MKKVKLFLGILIGLMIFSSCSSDDDSITQKNNKSLLKMKITTFKDNGEIESFATRVYEKNKPKTDSFYNKNNELTNYFNWTYDNGKFSSLKGFSSDNNLTYETSIKYDDTQRIINRTTINNNNISIINYTYNSDNTITSINEFNNINSTTTFFINNSGLIYKEVGVNGLKEVVYDSDNNVVSITENSIITNLTYDDINLPPENFPLNENFMFGSHKNNYILYQNSLGSALINEASTNPKFLITIEKDSDISITDWILNDENFPVNRKYYSQNRLLINYDYVYE